MGPRLRLALLIMAGAHLGLVVAGALEVHPRGGGWVSRAIAEYEVLSGTEGFYTFFAPGVDTQLRPIFEVTDGSGAVSTDVLQRAANTEVDLRIANMIGLSWYDDFRRTLEASWADVMFRRHPGAEQVVVRLDLCDLPSMREYREGRRPAWRVFDRATFSPRAGREVE
jgi:hypothetical protein